MLKRFKADLHIHTCLSPCADLQMSPRKIVAEAGRRGIDIIGICDHNSAKNVPALLRAALNRNLVVLPGMEVCTIEEVHVLALFDTVEAASELQAVVYANLHGENNPEVFGMQVVANEEDEVEGFEHRLLIGASDLTVEDVIHTVHWLEGLAIASHIDRESYSVIGQLGFIPNGLAFDALEISRKLEPGDAYERFERYRRYPMIRNSDAHVLADIGAALTEFELEQPSAFEIGKALRREGGRRIVD